MIEMRTTSGKTVKMRMSDLEGRRVRTKRDMSNGWGSILAGTECVVEGVWRAEVRLTAPRCQHCGVWIHISRVHRNDVLLIDDEAT